MSPRRIVSLVPSLTELVFWLGRGDQLVGRTRFCTEPSGRAGAVPALGGTKNPLIDKIVAAEPDLVLANKEENRREDIEALRAAGLHVMLTDPNTVEEALAMIRDIGWALDAVDTASELVGAVEAALLEAGAQRKVRVFVAVWHSPLMGLGSNTYGHSLLEVCGATNVLAERERYPEISLDDLPWLAPDLILLPDEPFPFNEGHATVYGKVAPTQVIDGKLLWWYGPRMPEAIRTLRELLSELPAGERE